MPFPAGSEWIHKPVGGADDENGLLAVHAVHLCQDLVQHAVRRAASVTHRRATLGGDAVQLIEEQHAGRALAGFVEDLAHLRRHRTAIQRRAVQVSRAPDNYPP